MYKVKNALFLFFVLFTSTSFGMKKKELESLSINELIWTFEAKDSPTTLKQQIFCTMLKKFKKQNIYFIIKDKILSISELTRTFPFDQKFLKDLWKAGVLQLVIRKNMRDSSNRNVMLACIKYCDDESLIKKIVAIHFLHYYRNFSTSPTDGVVNICLSRTKQENKIVYKHLLQRTYLYHILLNTSLPDEIVALIVAFTEEPFVSNQYEEQDNKERITFLKEKFGNFQINIDGKKIKTNKLFLRGN